MGQLCTIDAWQPGTLPIRAHPPVTGSAQTSPTAEGGALRAQSVRRAPGELAGHERVAPTSHRAKAPVERALLVGSGIAGADRIIAYGLRNPFRKAAWPGTDEIWSATSAGPPGSRSIGRRDGGWGRRESSMASTRASACRPAGQASRPRCVAPCTARSHPPPHRSTRTRAARRSSTARRGTGGNTISGLAFYPGGSYPTAYHYALFSDYSRDCIWAMLPGPDGAPDPTRRANFAVGADSPVDLAIGPGGDLYDSVEPTIGARASLGSSQLSIAVAHSDVRNGRCRSPCVSTVRLVRSGPRRPAHQVPGTSTATASSTTSTGGHPQFTLRPGRDGQRPTAGHRFARTLRRPRW
ncbi:MAG: hypothetical protein U0802_05860 [Candidatus Binatia bacterium]